MLQYPLFCHSSGSGSCAWGYLSGTNCQHILQQPATPSVVVIIVLVINCGAAANNLL
jgi:hypothetical protein